MVVIRLARYGRHKLPFYKIIVADRRKSCQGKFLEKIGFFNPFQKNILLQLKINIINYNNWLLKGALPTLRVHCLYMKYKLYINNLKNV